MFVLTFQQPTWHSSHLSPLTSDVVGAPQMTLQQYLSTLPCLPLPTGNLQTPFLSIPWSYLIISSPVFLSFLFLSLSPAELSLPCQRILRCGSLNSSFSAILNSFHHLSFVQYNVQSIYNKLDVLSIELSEFDILAFTESWLHPGILDEDLKLTNYHKPERKDRNNDPHGGVLIYIKDNLH